MSTVASPPVELTNVRVGYDGHLAVDGADLVVRPGEVVALLGANGSGKTTMIKTALGLLSPRSGRAALFGIPVSKFRDWRRVGYVPQRSGAGSGVPATVTEVVTVGLLAGRGRLGATLSVLRGLVPHARRADKSAVEAALTAMDLIEYRHRSVSTLSGGQQQRVLIARALVGKPDLLVLDEPTVGVDAASQRALANAIKDLVAADVAVLLVTHEMGVLTPLITRTVVMRRGTVMYDGPVQVDLHHHGDPHHAQTELAVDTVWGES